MLLHAKNRILNNWHITEGRDVLGDKSIRATEFS